MSTPAITNIPPLTFAQAPMVDENGRANPVVLRQFNDWATRIYNAINQQGQVIGPMVGNNTVPGRTVPLSQILTYLEDDGTLAADRYIHDVELFSLLEGMPSASQTVLAHAYSTTWTLPPNMGGSLGKVGTNPTATATLNVYRDATIVGTITISTSGTFTFATTSGLAVVFGSGTTLKIVAPASPDATMADIQLIMLINRTGS